MFLCPSDGTKLRTVFNETLGLDQFGNNGTLGTGGEWIASNALDTEINGSPTIGGLEPDITVNQPDNEGVFAYE